MVQWVQPVKLSLYHELSLASLRKKWFISSNKGNGHGNVQILSQSRKYEHIEILYQLSNDKPLIYMIGCPITPNMFNEPERRLFLIKYFIIAYKIGLAWLHKHLTSTTKYIKQNDFFRMLTNF